MKNIFVRISTLSLLASTLVFAIASTGCKLSKDERERKELEKGERLAARTEDRQEDKEAKKVEVAYSDLSERLRVYQGIAGVYNGQINKYNSSSLRDIRVSIVMVNLPAPIDEKRPETEADVIRKKEEIGFNIEIQEFNTGKKILLEDLKKPVDCSATNKKPDLATGSITVECPPRVTGDSPTKYVLGFETTRSNIKAASLQEIEDQNSLAVMDLIGNKIGKIEALRVTQSSPIAMGVRQGRVVREFREVMPKQELPKQSQPDEPTPTWLTE